MPPSGPQKGQDNAKALREGLSALRSAGTVAAVKPQNSLAAVVKEQTDTDVARGNAAPQQADDARASIVREMRAQESAAPSATVPQPFEAKQPATTLAPVAKQNLNESDSKPWTLIAAIAAVIALAALAWFFLRPSGSSSDAAPADPNPVTDPTTDGGQVDPANTDGSTDPVADDTGTTGATDPTTDDGSTEPVTDDGSTEPGETDGSVDPVETDDGQTDPGTDDGTTEVELEFPVGPAITPEELRNAPTSDSYVAGGTLVLEGSAPTQDSIDALTAQAAEAFGGPNVVVNMDVDPDADEPDLTTIYVRGTVTSVADFTDLLLETETLLSDHPESELRVVATPGESSINVADRTDAILKFFAGSGVDPERLSSNVLEGTASTSDDFLFLITNLLPQ